MGMKAALYRASWPVESVLGLHGRDENDLSAASPTPYPLPGRFSKM